MVTGFHIETEPGALRLVEDETDGFLRLSGRPGGCVELRSDPIWLDARGLLALAVMLLVVGLRMAAGKTPDAALEEPDQ